MLIYPNNDYSSSNNLFGDSYKSTCDRKASVNRTRVSRRNTSKIKKKTQKKKLTVKNIAFLKSLGLRVKKH